MKWSSRTCPPELQEKAKACKTPEDIVALAQAEGYTLSDEELEAVSGGSWMEGCPDHDCEDMDPFAL